MQLFTPTPPIISGVTRWLFLASFMLLGITTQAALNDTSTANVPNKEKVAQALTGLSVPFEENRGQADAKVAFQAKTLAGPLFVTKDGELVWSLTNPSHSILPSPVMERGPGG